ncbi:MAG: copper chaperone PCu(A)C [Candidatus Latescibacteria bacterium]|nr:copper chaperone PCu(A)C [Candidatus Latescibacterota bacterium]
MSKHGSEGKGCRYLVLCWALALMWLAAGCGQEPAAAIVVSEPWLKEPIPGRAMAAGFLKLENRGGSEEVLLGLECPDAAAVEMHEMFHEGDMMKMRKVARWTLPARGSLALAPGGGHLMFLGLRRPLKDGDTVQLTLHFKKAGDRTLSMPVKKP